jgi:signal transduction histidine kinase
VALLHKVEYTAKMASIGRLAAGVAHEINNPLAIINEKAGLLKDLVTYSDSFPQQERFLKHVDPILASVERCARITRRLLGFAKHMDLRQEPIKLENLLREVLGFLEKESTYRDITVRLNAEENVPVIESDRGRLQQVFLNIVNNAFGAVDDGGEIDIWVKRADAEHVSVMIQDNGCGIKREDLRSIFEPFFTTKQKHGTGLGLSITYGIVEKLGGKISVDSKLGEWTRFTVVLPIRPASSGATDGTDAGAAG